MENNKLLKFLMLGLVVVYVVSPDLIPGPVDDMLVMALGYLATSRKGTPEALDTEEY